MYNQSYQAQSEILVVDDTATNRRYLTLFLSQSGYQIRSAENGTKALELLNFYHPDLILLDIRMPEIDGYQLCEIIKKNPVIKDIPVIFISSLQEVFDKVRAFTVGGVDYITKPFEPLEVLIRVENQLKLRSLRLELINKNESLEREIQQRKKIEQDLIKANFELQKLANLDGLTEIANRRQFELTLHREWRRLQRDQLPLSLIIADIDYFKKYNDRYGHIQGDQCLRQVAKTIQDTVKRPSDLVARYGGEEFVIILPSTNLQGGVKVCQNIQKSITKLAIPHEDSNISKNVSLSLGISSLIPNLYTSPEILKITADQALYFAKQQGRNRYEAAMCDL